MKRAAIAAAIASFATILSLMVAEVELTDTVRLDWLPIIHACREADERSFWIWSHQSRRRNHP
jgi:hypothetical protein